MTVDGDLDLIFMEGDMGEPDMGGIFIAATGRVPADAVIALTGGAMVLAGDVMTGPSGNIDGLTGKVVAALITAALTGEVISALITAALTDDVIPALIGNTIDCATGDGIPGLTGDGIAALTGGGIAALTGGGIAALIIPTVVTIVVVPI
jgi:hypothetical protein